MEGSPDAGLAQPRSRKRQRQGGNERESWKARQDSMLRLEMALVRCEAEEKARASEGRHLWRVFPLQQLAFEAADSAPKAADIAVMSFETRSGGGRKFIACTEDEFWRRYRLPAARDRHYYEIIREGRPCRLYLDLEYKLERNPGVDGDARVELLISVLCDALARRYGVHCGRESVVDLDSTTDSKFSRHLVFHLPGCLFADNRHAGQFLREVLAEARERIAADPAGQEAEKLRRLWVVGGRGESTFLGDMGVYTRNRAFRLYGSSKFGRTARLWLSPHSAFPLPPSAAERGRHTDHVDPRIARIALVSAWLSHTAAAEHRLLTCPPQLVTSRCDATLDPELGGRVPDEPAPQTAGQQTGSSQPRGGGGGGAAVHSLPAARATRGLPPPGYPAHEQRRPPSWLPAIDEFVMALASHGAGPARIRLAHLVRSYDAAGGGGSAADGPSEGGWRWRPRRLLYDVVGSRFCARVGRQHRSNHVFWEVDLVACTTSQGCLDPDCGSFRSEPTALPIELEHEVKRFVAADEAAVNGASRTEEKGGEGSSGGTDALDDLLLKELSERPDAFP